MSLNCAFGQTRIVQWKDLPNKNEHIFPLAYLDGNTNIENAINNSIQNTYLNHEESYRDSFYEYESLNPTANICGVSITYEHEFNTAPGIMSFTDLQYFDLRSGEKLEIDKIFSETGIKKFLEVINGRKNNFVDKFKETISKDQDDYEKLIEITEYTKNDDINLENLSQEYNLVLETDKLKIVKNWEYAWGIGRHDLPNIVLELSYQEIEPMLNKYGIDLIITPKVIPSNKLLYGYIGGKYKISALVRNINDSIKITYWYESNKAPINWNGKVEKSMYLLNELDESSVSRASIELSFYQEGEKLRAFGTWKDLKKKKPLTIELFQY